MRLPFRSRCRVLVVLAAAVAMALGVGIRAWWLWDTAIIYPERAHETSEEVILGGAFFDMAELEPTKDYRVTVRGARLSSFNEYVREHGAEGSETREGFDEKSVVDLELEISNVGTEDGGFAIGYALLVNGGDYLMPNSDLWSLGESAVEPGQLMVSVRPGTSYVTHVPYTVNDVGDARYAKPLAKRDYKLLLSEIPVMHTVAVRVE